MLRQESSTGALQQTMRWPSRMLQGRMHSSRSPPPRHLCRFLPCSSLFIRGKTVINPYHSQHVHAGCCVLFKSIYTAFLPSTQAFSGLSLLDLPVSAPPMTSKDGEQPCDRLKKSSAPSQAAPPPHSQASSYSVLPCAEASPHLHIPVPHQHNTLISSSPFSKIRGYIQQCPSQCCNAV